jgi:hypothetical protein
MGAWRHRDKMAAAIAESKPGQRPVAGASGHGGWLRPRHPNADTRQPPSHSRLAASAIGAALAVAAGGRPGAMAAEVVECADGGFVTARDRQTNQPTTV